MKPNAKWLKNALRWIKRITDNISQNNKSHKHAHTIQWKWLHCDIQENIWIRYRNVISTLRPKKQTFVCRKKSRIAHTPKGKTNWNDTRTTNIHENPFWWFWGIHGWTWWCSMHAQTMETVTLAAWIENI